jgi:hypothetical protein
MKSKEKLHTNYFKTIPREKITNFLNQDWDSDQSGVIKDIYAKFNNNPKTKDISFEKATYLNKDDNTGSAGVYNPTKEIISIANHGSRYQELASTLGHELFHANSAKGDYFNFKASKHLNDLYNKQPYPNNDDFAKSLLNINNIINPRLNDSDYIFNTNQINNGAIEDNLNKQNMWAYNQFKDFYKTNEKQKKEPLNLEQIGEKIKNDEPNNTNNLGYALKYPGMMKEALDTHPQEGTEFLNKHAPFGLMDELPAYMSEKLTESWNTGETIPEVRDSLKYNEQEVLHKLLGDFQTAYPHNEYNNVYTHATNRRNSIENTDTWQKNQLQNQNLQQQQQSNIGSGNYQQQQQQQFNHGGRVTTPVKRGLSHYLGNAHAKRKYKRGGRVSSLLQLMTEQNSPNSLLNYL